MREVQAYRRMVAKEFEELFVREVETGIGTMDVSTDDGVTSERVVTQRITGIDTRSAEERELLLIHGASDALTVAEQLRSAAERAAAAEV